MRITLTGSPGTGKTTVAEQLSEEYSILHLTDFLEKHGIGEVVDGEREVPIQEMKSEISEADLSGKTLIEGHLAHHLESEKCIVLRCRPDKLEERLSERYYSDEKIKENVEAEALDIILSEAVEKQDTVIEIDTTDKTVLETVEQIKEKIKKAESDYGKIDWTEYL